MPFVILIDLNLEEDPELYASFAAELSRILTAFKQNWDEIYRLLEELRNKILSSQEEPTYGLNRKRQMPIFRKLHALVYDKKEPLSEDEISRVVAWTKEIYGMLKVELANVGFWNNPASLNRLHGEIANFIVAECNTIPFAFKNRKTIASEILAWAKDDRISAAILYAED